MYADTTSWGGVVVLVIALLGIHQTFFFSEILTSHLWESKKYTTFIDYDDKNKWDTLKNKCLKDKWHDLDLFLTLNNNDHDTNDDTDFKWCDKFIWLQYLYHYQGKQTRPS